MKISKNWLSLLSLLLVLFGFEVPLSRAEFFEIDSYQVSIQVTAHAELEVEEVIEARFLEPRHGIFRLIPVEYRSDSGGGTYKTQLYDIDVPGEQWQSSRKGANIEVRIGDPNSFVSGTQRYVIRYKVFGAIQFLDGFSELYWDAIGVAWDVPIHKASITVRAPRDLSLTAEEFFVYTGPSGSKSVDGAFSWDGAALRAETYRSLGPREGVTVGIKFPAGFLQNGDWALRRRFILANYGIVLLPLLAFAILCLVWRSVGRDEPLAEMVFFHPPKELTSAEAGVLEDDVSDNRDLTSLLMSWAAKGIVQLEEVDIGRGLGGGNDISIKRLGALPADARRYERVIFDQLFVDGDTVHVSSLKDRFYKTMAEARTGLDEEISQLGLYSPGSRGLGNVLKFCGIGVLFLLPLGDVIGGSALVYFASVAVTALLLFGFGRIMPKKTPQGRALFQQVRGFKQFMERVEEPQLRRLLEEDPLYFDKTIAFAVVFGMASVWATRFQGLLAVPPTWYASADGRGFRSMGDLGRSLDGGMETMSSAFSSSPKGSSSGGSSGGGRGGGGGGSW